MIPSLRLLFSFLGLALSLICLSRDAGAWSVGTGFTDPCHELMTLAARQQSQLDLLDEVILLPDSDDWEDVFAGLKEIMSIPEFQDAYEEFFYHSLLVGVREPDTDGHSMISLYSLRAVHSVDYTQYQHCLREADDDYEVGNELTVMGSWRFIFHQLELARLYLLYPPEEQIIEADFTLDFYGLMDVEVWAPAFYLGRALHTLQDSFSHTIRSDDLSVIWHAMNYIDAITKSHDECREVSALLLHLPDYYALLIGGFLNKDTHLSVPSE